MSSRLTIFLLSFFLFINPLVYLNTSEFPKFIFITTFSEILIIFYLLSRNRLNLGGTQIIATLFITVLFLSDILGIDTRTSLLGSFIRHQGFILYFSCFLIFLVASQKYDIQTVNKFKLSIIASSALLSILAIVDFLLLYFKLANIPNFGGRIVATMGNPNFLAGYVAMTLPFVLWSKINLKLKALIIFANFFVIVVTLSRSAIIASILVLAIYFYDHFGKIKTFFLIFTLSIIAIFLIYNNSSFLRQVKRSSPWDNRGIIWNQAMSIIKQKPFLGYGQENFELVFPNNLGVTVDSPHNIFLDVLLSSGIIGLLLFLDLLKNKFVQKNKIVNLSILSFLVVSFFNPVSVAEIALLWFFLGLPAETRIDK